MSVLVDLVGETVIDKDAQSIAVSNLVKDIGPGGIVGIYFSAHWCPPCRAFTPELATFYKKFRETEKGRKMDIIFVSSDKDDDMFKEYLNEMPWKAMPFADRDRKGKLSKMFKVQGIPTLVFIDAETGSLITTKGREAVGNDPDGKEFPWHPKPFTEIIKGELLKGDSTVQSDEALSGKVKGFYFSAHWCPPCRAFTPELVKTYEKVKADGKNFEIVFVSSDRTDETFKEYYKTMPWLSLPFNDSRIDQLSSYFEVEGIPMLVLLDENNEVITPNGRGALGKDKDGTNFPWHPAPVEEIGMDNASNLNDAACVFLFTNGNAALHSSAVELLSDTAKMYKEEQKASIGSDNELPILFFFYEGGSPESVEIATSLRNFIKLEGEEPVLALFDISEEKKYTMSAKNLTKDAVGKLVEEFKTGKLQLENLNL